MKLTYCYPQLLAWAEDGRAPDPAVDSAARAVDIDECVKETTIGPPVLPPTGHLQFVVMKISPLPIIKKPSTLNSLAWKTNNVES